MAAILISVTWTIYINCDIFFPWVLHIAMIGRAVLENDDDERTPEDGYTFSSPCKTNGSGELTIRFHHFSREIYLFLFFCSQFLLGISS